MPGEGSITNIHIARIKDTPSHEVEQAFIISGQGISGDRSCDPLNDRQGLIMDKEILDHFGLQPGQVKENITVSGVDIYKALAGEIMSIGNDITMQVTGFRDPCSQIDEIRPGLRKIMDGEQGRGILARVVNGGMMKVGDTIRLSRASKSD